MENRLLSDEELSDWHSVKRDLPIVARWAGLKGESLRAARASANESIRAAARCYRAIANSLAPR